ncbi:nucleotidyltransferase family protein [Arsenicitalea aurantiaca]|uniref:Nucleotidyltransferase family protein n=1 Tax=Arsenicitalea aurantiaca TaxID=1783274 RepID=A0A433XKY6_9HYPH|nr:nucleotidyltransferase family protein [Arsenicitalea aurantiaca]RUT34668.1 nucleotidyltransferase family protein [Arsenicitalea aurantiaca]
MTRLADYAAIVLAAGQSRRFGSEDKLMATLKGRPLVAHGLDALGQAGIGEVIVVTGPDEGPQREALTAGFPIVVNSEPERGMGRSIGLGAACLKPGRAGIFVVPADMPDIAAQDYLALAEALAGHDAVRFVHEGVPGHPVLFAGALRDRLCGLDGEEGGRMLLRSLGSRLRLVPTTSPGIVRDVDRPADLTR